MDECFRSEAARGGGCALSFLIMLCGEGHTSQFSFDLLLTTGGRSQ